MATLFISDLHLDESRPAVTHALLDFLHRNAGLCQALYILGDLFEVWIGDDDDHPLGTRVSRALKAFQTAGSHVFLMHGNRDFLLGERFCQSAGATLLQDPTTISLSGKKTLLLHGDSLCTEDNDYQAFRAKVREPSYQRDLLAQPLEERRKLAKQLRQMSHEANSNKAADIMDVTASAVIATFEQHQARTMIHGHTHRPARHVVTLQNSVAERIVLGDWSSHGWYIKAVEGEIDLLKFKIRQ
ncbi:MAG: UDP-2,3-diacylglucosamine hydrolase [Halieaceae bacterium]|jgi:UDP-2,3-diacylglucosamine hydrolase